MQTKKLAISGIMTAVTVILLYLENIAPTGRLGFYALAAFVTAIVVIECGIYYAFLFYAASSALAFFLVPNKLEVFPYLLFLGIYGIVKYLIERVNKRVYQYILKLAFFNVILIVFWFFLNEVVFQLINLEASIFVIIRGSDGGIQSLLIKTALVLALEALFLVV